MVLIRLACGGARKRPFYNIVVTDSRRPRDSGYLERIGYFNPRATAEESYIELDRERMDYWVGQGARISARVNTLSKRAVKPRAEQKPQKKTKVHKPQQATHGEAIDEAAKKAVAAEQQNATVTAAQPAGASEDNRAEAAEDKSVTARTDDTGNPSAAVTAADDTRKPDA